MNHTRQIEDLAKVCNQVSSELVMYDILHLACIVFHFTTISVRVRYIEIVENTVYYVLFYSYLSQVQKLYSNCHHIQT